jgi:hypothetical protein
VTSANIVGKGCRVNSDPNKINGVQNLAVSPPPLGLGKC